MMIVVMIMGLMITFHQVNVGLGLPPCASQTNSLDLKVFLDNQIRYHQHHQHHHEYHVHLMRSNIFSLAVQIFLKNLPADMGCSAPSKRTWRENILKKQLQLWN